MVALQRLRQGVVDDKAHVWLVDAHAKGNGGGNDLHLVSCPVLLHSLPLLWRQASMVIPAQSTLSGPVAHYVYRPSHEVHDYCSNTCALTASTCSYNTDNLAAPSITIHKAV